MRPQQNNNFNHKRGRGRNRNGGGGGGGNNSGGGGGKPQNILHRNFESTGPDVKVRGNAQHVYEKYLQLARDANSGGDRVMAESYLQHAEHYYRIIAAAQASMPQQAQHQGQNNNGSANGNVNGNGNGNSYNGQGMRNGHDDMNDDEGGAEVESTVPRHNNTNENDSAQAEDEQPVL